MTRGLPKRIAFLGGFATVVGILIACKGCWAMAQAKAPGQFETEAAFSFAGVVLSILGLIVRRFAAPRRPA